MRKTNLKKIGQEEMVGFALIIVILAVIILIFLGFSLSKSNKEVESYEVESFVTALTHYTSQCQDNKGNFLEVKDLIIKCDREEVCLGGSKSCEVLNTSVYGLLQAGWPVSSNSPVKGYSFSVLVNERSMDGFGEIVNGNKTSDSRGTRVALPKTDILMTVYY